MKDKNVVLGMSGGIAAYKCCELVSRLKKASVGVDVIMTESATQFVAPLTLETLSNRPVVVDMFNRSRPWEVEHISLAKKADVFVVAPATANIVAKLACGLADDMLTTTFLAATCPKIVVVAMNTNMYNSEAFQENIKKLKNSGVIVVDSDEGWLACGDVGKGKMAEPSVIFEKIQEVLHPKKDLIGKKVLVTSGGTVQPIDDVRVLANRSSGKMGCEIAREAKNRGASVTLVLGSHTCQVPSFVDKVVSVQTTQQMLDSVKDHFNDCDISVFAAAPSDYKTEIKNGKIKDQKFALNFEKDVDIAKTVSTGKKSTQMMVVFAAETENLKENAQNKLQNKNADMVVANDVSKEGSGFDCDTNVVSILKKGKQWQDFDKLTKKQVAGVIFDTLLREDSKA